MSFAKLPPKATLKPTKFEAEAPQQELDDFKQLLKLSRLGPKTYENSGKDERPFGVTYEWMSNAKQVWESEYDWRKTEAHINSFPNFIAPIQDDDGTTVPIHFVALFSSKADAVPITFLHGWPGSFLEFLPILEILRSKYTPDNLPFHVVVPSLPGYGYSADSTPKDKDFKRDDLARVMNKLMVGLGFGGGYVAQGGDIGSFVSRILAVKYDACKAVHPNFDPVNFCIMAPPKNASSLEIDELEKKHLPQLEAFGQTGNAYAREHGTRPSTIGHVLSSSPLALLAWIGEKFIHWTDTTPPLSQILDSVTLYWLTSSFPRAIYPYRQLSSPVHDDPECRIPTTKHFGFSWFPHELGPVPKSWIATTGDLSWYRQHQAGGHFAAMEKPDELLGDVEEFVGSVWGGEGGAKL